MYDHQSLSAKILHTVYRELQKWGVKMWTRFKRLRDFVKMIVVMNTEAQTSKAFLD
jgi:hypothetical protein